MYHRIKNKMDMEIIKEFLEAEKTDRAVLSRIDELTSVLDGAYGASRGSSDMGGYVLLFTDSKTYVEHISKVMETYHLEKDLSEYSEQMDGAADGNVHWHEELYLLSSDDALVLIYPKEPGAV